MPTTKTYFFYDLETSGLSPRDDRIMQFAGQRTDMELNPIGQPYNLLVRLADDTLPSPEALMVTGITPQKTVEEGYSEAEFAKIIIEDVFTPHTIAVGFNTIRFDDEFIRHLLWRNFYDPYEWTWKDGRSRWDLLDVIRMTRALRPEGIEWPFTDDGVPTNRLELITALNGISHTAAHDALSDVTATIDVARLIKTKHPDLYGYLLKMRDKSEVKKLVNLDDKKPFVYVSGRYENEFMKTTVAFPLTAGRNGNVLTYDLRQDPSEFLNLTEMEITAIVSAPYEVRKKTDFKRLPIKELQYNRAPAVAPLGVLEQGDGWKKIGLDKATVDTRRKMLLAHPQFAENVRSSYENKPAFPRNEDPEAGLYDGFLPDRDRLRVETVRQADMQSLADFHPDFTDERLGPLLLHYKARNYPSVLSESEAREWEEWRSARIQRQLPGFIESIKKISATSSTGDKDFLLSEMKFWLESVMPADY